MGVDYDNRTSLVGSRPFSLVFGEKGEQRTFSLTEEIGRGSSCITYLATEEGAGSRPKATLITVMEKQTLRTSFCGAEEITPTLSEIAE
jgi:hypothetical protein